jgi:hypothetical protein
MVKLAIADNPLLELSIVFFVSENMDLDTKIIFLGDVESLHSRTKSSADILKMVEKYTGWSVVVKIAMDCPV